MEAKIERQARPAAGVPGDVAGSGVESIPGEAIGDVDRLEGIATALLGQRDVYGLLARLFFAPLSQEEVDRLRAACLGERAAGLRGAGEASEELADGLAAMGQALDADGDVRLDLNVDYTSAFYGVNQYEGRVAVPYESVFRGGEGCELYGACRGEVFEAMKHDALRLREGIDLPEDHLSFELQYLAVLCGRAAVACQSGDTAAVRELVGKMRAFIAGHPLAWLDDLAELAGKLVESPFYPGLLQTTGGFLRLACEELDEMAAALAV